MKSLLLISAFFLTITFSTKGNVDCIYTSSKSGITIRVSNPCFSKKYQSLLDSFVNQLNLKIKRIDTSYKILVLINIEQLYYDFSGTPDYFTSVGVDTLREMNSNFINSYCYEKYSITDQSKPNPLDINATDNKSASNEIGIKIIYNIDYRKKINWTEIEKLINFSALNFNKIKITQEIDTVRHYSWYVSLPTLDTTNINEIIGRNQSEKLKSIEKSKYWLLGLVISSIGFFILLVYLKLRKQQSSKN